MLDEQVDDLLGEVRGLAVLDVSDPFGPVVLGAAETSGPAYGLAMAEQCGFPKAVLDDARELRSVVREKFPVLMQQHTGSERSIAAINLQHLLLLRDSALEPHAMQLYLHNLLERIPDSIAEDMLVWQKVAAVECEDDNDSEQQKQVQSKFAKV